MRWILVLLAVIDAVLFRMILNNEQQSASNPSMSALISPLLIRKREPLTLMQTFPLHSGYEGSTTSKLPFPPFRTRIF